jgi:hypothetical protein
MASLHQLKALVGKVLMDREPDAQKNTPETEWRRQRNINDRLRMAMVALSGLIEAVEEVASTTEEAEELWRETIRVCTLLDPTGEITGFNSPGVPGNPGTPGIGGRTTMTMLQLLADAAARQRDDEGAIEILRGGLHQTAEQLSALELELFETFAAGIGGGVSDHGALTGLADDDHPQYLLRSLIDAKGDLVGGTADNTFARLAVGANLTVLMADSAQAIGFKWAAQSLIDHGSLGGLTDDDHTQYTRKDTLTTKGDGYFASAASTPARLAVGVNHRAIVAASAESLGVKYGGAVNQHLFTTGAANLNDLRHDFCHAQAALSTLAVTIDRLYAFPFWLPRPIGFDRLGFELTTASAGAGKVRVGIYSSTSETDPAPSALVYDSGEFSGADVEGPGLGVKEKTGLSQTIATPGLYWFAFVAGTSAPTVRALAPGAIIPVLGMDAAGGARNGGVIRTFTYAALPDPWGTPTTRSAAMPQVFVRVASAA